MAIDYLEAAVEIARRRGRCWREGRAQKTPDISYKGDYDLVTQADKRSEAVIVSPVAEVFFRGNAVAAERGEPGKRPGRNTSGMWTRWTGTDEFRAWVSVLLRFDGAGQGQ